MEFSFFTYNKGMETLEEDQGTLCIDESILLEVKYNIKEKHLKSLYKVNIYEDTSNFKQMLLVEDKIYE